MQVPPAHHYPQHPEVSSVFGDGAGAYPEEVGHHTPSHVPSAGPNEPPPPPRAATNYDLESVDPLGCLTGIAGCSLIVIIQAAVECGADYNEKGCKDEYGFAVAAGVLSFFFAVLGLVVHACCSPLFFKRSKPVFGIVLFLIWVAGVGVATFKAPFADTGNGFFASWACFVTSFLLAGSSSRRLRTFLGKSMAKVTAGSVEAKLSSAIFAASVVLFVATLVKATERTGLSSDEVKDDVKSAYEKTTNQEAWGLACSLGSALLILIHKSLRICCENCTLHPMYIGIPLSIWWTFGAGVLTFDEPFKDGGNGYFACWVALICSLWFTYEARDGYDEVAAIFGRGKYSREPRSSQGSQELVNRPPQGNVVAPRGVPQRM